MSFSSQVKDELCVPTADPCCEKAQTYGLLQAARAFSAEAVTLQTEHAPTAERYAQFLRRVCGVTPHKNERPDGSFLLTVPDAADRLRVLTVFGHETASVALRLNRSNLECEHCAAAYLAGVFLSCGAVTNPQTDYHLEFQLSHYNLCRDILVLLKESGLQPKYMNRKGTHVIYFKESEQIEDCLTFMGATNASLELMGVKMIKDIRNNVNRAANCEAANIDKIVAASARQRESIQRLVKAGRLETLPPELRELASLRLEYPELSLRELGERLSTPLGRSGVNHRLQRIQQLADELNL